MTFPVSVNISDSLRIEIHLHEFFLGDRSRHAWTYLTHGLQVHGQKEMSLSLLVDDDANHEDVPKTPVKMFSLLERYAAEGRLVDAGDATRLGQRGIFGFTALFYVPAIQYVDLPDLSQHLGIMLVHQDEYEYAKEYGLTRFLSRLGKFCSTFPYPTWNTQVRPSLSKKHGRELSLLADNRHINTTRSFIHEDRFGFEFTLHEVDRAKLLDAMKLQDNSDALIVNCAFSPSCDASLYWEEGLTIAGAYASPKPQLDKIGGSFLALHESKDRSAGIVEDGYFLSIKKSDLTLLKQAIEQKNPLTLALDKRSFRLVHLDGTITACARSYESVAVWKSLDPDSSAPVDGNTQTNDAPRRVTIGARRNLTGSRSLAERVHAAELDIYLSRIEKVLVESLADETEQFELSIELAVYPKKVSSKISATIDLNPEFLEFVEETIATVPPCRVRAQIKIGLHLSLNPELRIPN